VTRHRPMRRATLLVYATVIALLWGVGYLATTATH
jgi:hypothetical protein